MSYTSLNRLTSFFLFFLFCYTSNIWASQESCAVTKEKTSLLLEQIKNDNNEIIGNLNKCQKSDRLLFAKIITLNPRYFRYSSDELKNDGVFISNFAATSPTILEYMSDRLKNNQSFIKKITKIYPKSLKYASPKLTNNKGFMIDMVKANPKNFTYASYRLQDDVQITTIAAQGDGRMIKFASNRLQNNKNIVKEAIKSNYSAINFASEASQNNPQIKEMVAKINYSFLDNIDSFLKENYAGLSVGPGGSRGYHIVNSAYFFPYYRLFDNPHISKWDRIYEDNLETDKLKLSAKSSNLLGWKIELKDYPKLITEIENIFLENNIDQNTIDSLNALSFWLVSDEPETVAFDLYLMRKADGDYFNNNFANITSLNAIASWQENKGKWKITIVDSIFDVNLKMNLSYKNGHRRYKIWDLYDNSNDDKNLKILYKIEDEDSEYFELFIKQLNDGYASVYRGGGYAIDNIIF
jgi:hypothetical protein